MTTYYYGFDPKDEKEEIAVKVKRAHALIVEHDLIGLTFCHNEDAIEVTLAGGELHVDEVTSKYPEGTIGKVGHVDEGV